MALGCLCAFCSAATFMNQLINHIRMALPPCLSLTGRGRFGAAPVGSPVFLAAEGSHSSWVGDSLEGLML